MARRPEYTGILPFLVKALSLFNLYVCFINFFFPGPFPIMNCVKKKKKTFAKICLNLKKKHSRENILLFLSIFFFFYFSSVFCLTESNFQKMGKVIIFFIHKCRLANTFWATWYFVY